MTGGSQQLRLFRRAIRDGATLEEACTAAGTIEIDGKRVTIISPAEGRIHLAADAKNPPPPEAYELIGQLGKEPVMGRTARPKSEPQAQEIPQKDFAGAVKIYRQDIKPAKTKQGEFGQEQSTAYKAIKKNCHVQPGAAKVAFSIAEMEDAHRDDYLICLNGLFKELGIDMPRDLVTMADGTEGGSIIPEGERAPLKLVTVPSDGTETDLADAGETGDPAAGDDDFTEATEEELATQRDRPGNADAEEEPAEAAE